MVSKLVLLIQFVFILIIVDAEFEGTVCKYGRLCDLLSQSLFRRSLSYRQQVTNKLKS